MHNQLATACLFVVNSAKVVEENEITPQSNYVFIYHDGFCYWDPRYELSVSQCPVDVTWFPFDKQVCELVFESWVLDDDALDLIVDNESIALTELLPPDAWLLAGTHSAGSTMGKC